MISEVLGVEQIVDGVRFASFPSIRLFRRVSALAYDSELGQGNAGPNISDFIEGMNAGGGWRVNRP
jgi:hypothetical protein